MGLKRKTREVVIQTLYGLTYCEKNPILHNLDYLSSYADLLDNIASEFNIRRKGVIYTGANEILKKLIVEMDNIDEILNKNAGSVKLINLGVLEIAILRLAIFEMKFLNVPSAIAINEAVDIAKKYSAEKSPAVINAILDKICKP